MHVRLHCESHRRRSGKPFKLYVGELGAAEQLYVRLSHRATVWLMTPAELERYAVNRSYEAVGDSLSSGLHRLHPPQSPGQFFAVIEAREPRTYRTYEVPVMPTNTFDRFYIEPVRAWAVVGVRYGCEVGVETDAAVNTRLMTLEQFQEYLLGRPFEAEWSSELKRGSHRLPCPNSYEAMLVCDKAPLLRYDRDLMDADYYPKDVVTVHLHRANGQSEPCLPLEFGEAVRSG